MPSSGAFANNHVFRYSTLHVCFLEKYCKDLSRLTHNGTTFYKKDQPHPQHPQNSSVQAQQHCYIIPSAIFILRQNSTYCSQYVRSEVPGGIVGPTNLPTPSPSSVFPISQYLPPSTKITSPFRALSVIRSPTDRATSSGVLRPKPVGATISSVTRPDFVQFGAMQLILMGTGNLEVCGSNPRMKPNTACFDVAKLCG